MLHQTRWTPQKISRRLAEIQALEYHQRQALPPFRFKALEEDDISAPPIEPDIDVSDWEKIPHHQYWGRPRLNFVLRTTFCLPPGWERRGNIG